MAVKRTRGQEVILTIDGVSYTPEIGDLRLEAEEADNDFTTFEDEANGGATQWFLRGTAVMDFQAASFWRLLWAETGNEIAYVFKPYTATVGASSPEFTGNVRIGRKPPIGGATGSTWTFDFEAECTAEPAMDVTA